MYDGPLDEDATHVLPTKSRDVEKGVAVVDGMAVLHRMQSTALGTVVDTYKDVSLKYATREARLQGQRPVQ